MRRLLTLAVTVLAVALVPLAAATSLDTLQQAGLGTADPAQQAERAAQAVKDEVAPATGAEAPPPSVLPEEPGFDVGPIHVALAGLALAGLSLAAYALFAGGARFITKDEVLENDVRASIYNYLRAKVGANLKSITDDLHLTTTNAIWHLRKLEDAGLIHSRRFNGYKVFYPAEGGVAARRLSLSVTALNNENAQRVFEYVVANPGAHQREIARILGVNHGTVRWHLKKLRRAELLTEVRRGKTSAYYATDVGVEALQTVRPTVESHVVVPSGVPQ